jgi:hypothetical protein
VNIFLHDAFHKSLTVFLEIFPESGTKAKPGFVCLFVFWGFFLAILGFELRTLHLLGRGAMT